jgi:nitrogen regulatory protein PII
MSDDLISRSALKQKMMKSHEQHGNTSELISALERDIRIIDEQPTAYDVDKVIENIKKSYSAKTYNGLDTPIYLIPVDKVIEIIKGSDDV